MAFVRTYGSWHKNCRQIDQYFYWTKIEWNTSKLNCWSHWLRLGCVQKKTPFSYIHAKQTTRIERRQMSIESHNPLHCYSGLWAHGPPWSTLSRSKLLSICNSFIANKNELFSKRTCLILSITRTSYISPEATNNQQQNKQHNQQVEKINSCDRERETNKQPWMRVIIKYSEPLCECKFIVPCRRTLEIHSVERTYNCCKYFFCVFLFVFFLFSYF